MLVVVELVPTAAVPVLTELATRVAVLPEHNMVGVAAAEITGASVVRVAVTMFAHPLTEFIALRV